MGRLSMRIWIFNNTELIQMMDGQMDVQLRFKKNDGFYMTSPITGNHFVKSDVLDSRVISHWKGFQANQK